jgi:putative ABC transport system permease protein
MRVRKSFKLAVNILLHSKLRSWLTIIGIVIGVAAIVAIVSIGEGAQASIQSRLSGLGADIVTLSPGGQRAGNSFRGFGENNNRNQADGKNLTNTDIQIVRSVDGVLFVYGSISGREDVNYLSQTISVSVQGVDPLPWRNMITTGLQVGRYLNPGDTNSIVIGNNLATKSFKTPLNVNTIISVGGKPYKIVGILEASGGFGGSDNAIYMPIEQARTLLNVSTNYYQTITFKVDDANNIDTIVNATDQKLMISRHVSTRTKDYSLSDAKAVQANVQSVTQTFTLFLAAIAAVSLLVGAVGIANTLFTSVLEKTKEIGIMKAIGAKNSDIMVIFLINSGLVGLVGGVIGIILGVTISSILPTVLGNIGGIPGGVTTVVPISLLIEAISVSVAIGMIAGAIPAYRASKLKPVDALRYE